MSDKPATLQQAIVHFADKDVAHQYLVDLRWSDGVVCPFCEGKEHSYLTTRKTWKCKACKKQFSVKVGTIFENSPIGLDKWLPAVWMIANAKNGISSCEIARALGVTQKSAWFMLHRIRLAMQSGTFETMSAARRLVTGKELPMADKFKQAMDDAAYKSILKVNPGVIDALKVALKNGEKAKQIEKRFRKKYGQGNLTAMSAVCAAYHMEAHPELLREEADQHQPPAMIDGAPVTRMTNSETEYRGQTWITLIPSEGEDSRIWEFSLTTGKIIQTAR